MNRQRLGIMTLSVLLIGVLNGYFSICNVEFFCFTGLPQFACLNADNFDTF